MLVETHPLSPFLPSNSKVLLLGSFPPPKYRWSMDFFYPNFQNDMWRIIGYLFFNDKNYFSIVNERKFNYSKIVNFCESAGIAFFDTASAIQRLNNDASDKFIKIVQPADINHLLYQIPDCNAVAATGQKAAEILSENWECSLPNIGSFVNINLADRELAFFRMPSSSRAYPLAFENKANSYRILFESVNLLSPVN
jgi:G:T/U-mismatch repair DNA glycosylase